MKFNNILYIHLYWQDLGWDCYVSVFAIFKELLPLIHVRISFLLNIRRMIRIIVP